MIYGNWTKVIFRIYICTKFHIPKYDAVRLTPKHWDMDCCPKLETQCIFWSWHKWHWTRDKAAAIRMLSLCPRSSHTVDMFFSWVMASCNGIASNNEASFSLYRLLGSAVSMCADLQLILSELQQITKALIWQEKCIINSEQVHYCKICLGNFVKYR